ncbi:MAG: hypothetical protein ABGX16_08205 [Pirellulales bacterium]
MNQILLQVARARRKLQLELFLQHLVYCWTIGLVVAGVAIGLPKLILIAQLPTDWTGWWILGSLVVGFFMAIVWTGWKGYDDMATAMEIDCRYQLRERLASSLSLDAHTVATPAGQALLADTRRTLSKLDVTEQFPVRLGQRAWLPLIPAMLLFSLVTWFDDRQAQSRPVLENSQVPQKQLEDTASLLRKQLVEKCNQAANAGLKDAETFLRKLEKEADTLSAIHPAQRRKALVKLNDLASQIAKRQQPLGNRQALRKQFAQMKNLGHGPADKLAEAMQQGQWSTAGRELDQLRTQITNSKLSPQSNSQLVHQLQQMQKKLQATADARQQTRNELNNEIDKQRQQGNLASTAQRQQQLEKRLPPQNQTQRMQQLGQQLGQLGQSIAQGDQPGAKSDLQQIEQQFAQIEQELAESELLDTALDQFQFAKDCLNGLACTQCEGTGCQACQRSEPGSGQGKSDSEREPGRDGFGSRAESKNEVKFQDSHVPQKAGRGSAVIAGAANGPNQRGQVTESIQKEMASQGSEPADPLVMEQLPRSHREHAQQYFNLLRRGASY